MQMSLGLTLNVIVGFSVVDGRWRGREAILDLDFTISHRCKCQFCQKRFSLRVLALRRVCKQMTIVAMRPCCKTGAKVVPRRSTTLRFWLNRCHESHLMQAVGRLFQPSSDVHFGGSVVLASVPVIDCLAPSMLITTRRPATSVCVVLHCGTAASCTKNKPLYSCMS